MERLLRALRRARQPTARDPSSFARELLEVVRQETSSARLTLRRGRDDGDVVVGEDAPVGSAALELRITVGQAEALFLFERARPADEAEARFAEALAGEVLLRIEHDRADRVARGAARQLALLDSVTRAGEGDHLTVSELADRAAGELSLAFSTISIALHVVVDDRLELVARRLEDGSSGIDTAPPWLRSIATDSHLLQAVAATQRTIVTRKTSELHDSSRQPLEVRGIRRLVVTPLLVGGTLIGTMSLAHGNAEGNDAENELVITGVATRVAFDLANAQRLEEERQRSRDLELLKEIGSLVAQQRDLSAVLTAVVNELARVGDIPQVSLLLADPERRVLTNVACTQELEARHTVDIDGRASASHAFRTGQPVIVEDAQAEADPGASRERAEVAGVRSALAVPLITKGEVIGVIVIAEPRRRRTFSTTEVARFTAVANVVSPVIANAQMFDDLRRSYEALSRAQAELVRHERLAALGELSAVIAHEVRNPLAVIYNSLGSLRRLSPRRDEAGLLLDIVEEEAARLNRIVADLLDFVRPYSSHPRPVRLETLVRGAIEGARRANARSTVEIKTELDLDSTPLVLDGTMIEQALTNLVVNALQATSPGGAVVVRAWGERSKTGESVCFDIADEGPGVDDADTTNIFQPFYTTKAAGTGLGLAVVRRIAETLGGKVEVRRGEERGAIFTLTVPVADMSSATS